MVIAQIEKKHSPNYKKLGFDFNSTISRNPDVQKTNTPEYQAGIVSFILGDGFFNFSSTFHTFDTLISTLIIGSLAWAAVKGAARYGINRTMQKLGDLRVGLGGKYGETFEGKLTQNFLNATVDNPYVQAELSKTAKSRGITLEALKEEIWANTLNKFTYSTKDLGLFDKSSEEMTKAFEDMNARIANGEDVKTALADFQKTIQKEARSLRKLFNGKGGFSLKGQLLDAFDYALGKSGVDASEALNELARAQIVNSANKMQKFTAMPASIQTLLKSSPKNMAKGVYKFLKKVYLPTKLESQRAQALYSKNITSQKFWEQMAKDPDVREWFRLKYGDLWATTKSGKTITIENMFKNKNNHNPLLEDPKLRELFTKKSLTKWDRWGKSALAGAITLGVIIWASNIFESQGTEDYNYEVQKQQIIESQDDAAKEMSKHTSSQSFMKYFPEIITNYNLNWTNSNYIAAPTLSKKVPDHMEPRFQTNVAYATSAFYKFDNEAQLISKYQKTYNFNVTLPPFDSDDSPVFFRAQVGFQPRVKDNHKVSFNFLPEVSFENGYIKFGAGKEKTILSKIPYAQQLAGKNAQVSITLIPPNLQDASDMGSAIVTVKIPGSSPSMNVYKKEIKLGKNFRRLFENSQISDYEMVPSVTLVRNLNFVPKQK